MEIKTSDIRLPTLQRLAPTMNSVIGDIKVGALLNATVVSNDAEGTLLKVGNQLFQAPATSPLKPGQAITLRIEQLGPPLQMRVQLPAVQTTVTAVANANIRQLLPRQAELPQLLANVSHLAQHATGRSPLPESLQQAIRQLLNSMTSSQRAGTSEGLKQALRESGLFMERNWLTPATSTKQASSPAASATLLAPNPTGQTNVQGDLKATLARLVALANNSATGSSQDEAKQQSPQQQPMLPQQPATGGDLKAAMLKLLATLQQLQLATTSSHNPVTQADEAADDTLARSVIVTPAIDQPPSLPLKGQALHAIGPQPPSLTDDLPMPALLKELQHETQQSLARISLLQLAGLPTPDQPSPSWCFELPVRHQNAIDLFKLRIEQEDGSNEQATNHRTWLIQLAFNLESLGAVHAHVRLKHGRVSANIWTEQPQTATLFNEHMQQLHNRLSKQGLNVGDFNCQPGPPPQNVQQAYDRNRIVDVKA